MPRNFWYNGEEAKEKMATEWINVSHCKRKMGMSKRRDQPLVWLVMVPTGICDVITLKEMEVPILESRANAGWPVAAAQNVELLGGLYFWGQHRSTDRM